MTTGQVMECTPKYELRKIQSEFPRVRISCSRESEQFIRGFYGPDIEIFESFFLVTLDRSNHTTGYVKISQGGTFSTVVETKLIAKYALDGLAHGVIIAHNHPSGNLEPSQQDFIITRKIEEALKLFDISLLDHIILTPNSYMSFRDESKM